ncbi:peptidylprolyl isomerase [Desulfobacterales bacterium HSG16]|nr:peptidylprolyl isomerase [Desulfobacterales bacterium HSG16]
MEKVTNDLFVSVDYKGTLENGDVFDTSSGRAPLEVKMGAGQLIKGFEDALMGMELREKKTFTLDPTEAYGPRNEDHVHVFNRTEIPPEMNPKVGEMIGLSSPDGQQIPAMIAHVDEKQVKVDMNHPLAGKSLTFQIEVVGISSTPTQASPGASGCGCDCGSEHDCGSKPEGECSSDCCQS